jgi:uncharacterized protein
MGSVSRDAVFVDTSFYVVILNPRDSLHSIAESVATNCGDVVTTEYVLVEVGNILARTGNKKAFMEFMNQLEADDRTTIIPAGRTWFARGMELYSSHLDKKWSLTDCISFAVMRSYSLREAATADHHFEQAGYKALMGSK